MSPAAPKTHLILALAVTVLWTMTACQEKKQLDEMHDSTVEMNKTTKDLRDNTVEMKKTTEQVRDNTVEMKTVTKTMAAKIDTMDKNTQEVVVVTKQMNATTDELYDASRQGASLEIRRKSLEALLAAESSGKKVAEAAKYFMAFEFQLWTGAGQDADAEKRDQLMTDAAAEFFKDLKEVQVESAPWFNPFAKADGTEAGRHSRANKEASFNAIAAALHRVNRKQEENLKAHPGQKPVTMYSMLKEALLSERDVNDGKKSYGDLKGYEREIQNNRAAAVNLLQARHNFIAMIFMNEVLPKETWSSYFANGWTYYTGSWTGGAGWEMDIDSYNLAQMKTKIQYMKALESTRALLRDLGIQPEVDPTLKTFLDNMTIAATKGKGGPELVAARIEFLEALKTVRQR